MILVRCTRLLAIIFAALMAPFASADWATNMPEGVTRISKEVYDLHMIVFWVCVVIGILVFGAMFVSIVLHRKSKGAKPASFHENTIAEFVWTIIPVVVLVTLAVFAGKLLVEMEDTSKPDMTVKITGYQWKWEYEYLDNGVRFFSNLDQASRDAGALGSDIDPASVENYLLEVDNRLVLPVGKRIRFLVTSNDVIHSWWVPDFAVKKDAIPGFINAMWTKIEEGNEGVYRGKCTELCGKDHGYMPVVVEVVSQDRYDEWVGEQLAAAEAEANSADREWTMDELMTKGEAVYKTACVACHQANGQGLPGVFPALAGSPVAIEGDGSKHIDIILNGVSGTAMAAYANQLSDVDVAAVVTYERNAWGNNTGQAIQPATVKAMR